MATGKQAFITYLQDYPEIVDRLVGYAFKENPNIKDVGDFKDALITSWNTSSWENGVVANLNDDETKLLFESNECKERIKENLSEEEYNKIYDEIRRDEIEVQRTIRKGKPIKKSQLIVIQTPKKIKVSSHSRTGLSIKPYNRGFRRWTPSEARFLRVRKQRKLTPNQIITEFNKHFKENPRTSSSIKTKIYRI
jgi:hypothetical protein